MSKRHKHQHDTNDLLIYWAATGFAATLTMLGILFAIHQL